MLVGQLKDIENETNECQVNPTTSKMGKQAKSLKAKMAVIETIHRLYQMGFVVDWTVEDFFRNIYEVEWSDMPMI